MTADILIHCHKRPGDDASNAFIYEKSIFAQCWTIILGQRYVFMDAHMASYMAKVYMKK